MGARAIHALCTMRAVLFGGKVGRLALTALGAVVLLGVAVATTAALCAGVAVSGNVTKAPAVGALAELGLVDPSFGGHRGTKHEELSLEDLLDQRAIGVFKGEGDRRFQALDLI